MEARLAESQITLVVENHAACAHRLRNNSVVPILIPRSGVGMNGTGSTPTPAEGIASSLQPRDATLFKINSGFHKINIADHPIWDQENNIDHSIDLVNDPNYQYLREEWTRSQCDAYGTRNDRDGEFNTTNGRKGSTLKSSFRSHGGKDGNRSVKIDDDVHLHSIDNLEAKYDQIRQKQHSLRNDISVCILSIPDILPKQLIETQNPEDILFEGELCKYKPGVTYNYISRWCIVTKSEFKYYKNRFSAHCWMDKPLVRIPLACVKSAQRAAEVPNFKLKPSPQDPKMYGFQFAMLINPEDYQKNASMMTSHLLDASPFGSTQRSMQSPGRLNGLTNRLSAEGDNQGGFNEAQQKVLMSSFGADEMYSMGSHSPSRRGVGKHTITERTGHLMREPRTMSPGRQGRGSSPGRNGSRSRSHSPDRDNKGSFNEQSSPDYRGAETSGAANGQYTFGTSSRMVNGQQKSSLSEPHKIVRREEKIVIKSPEGTESHVNTNGSGVHGSAISKSMYSSPGRVNNSSPYRDSSFSARSEIGGVHANSKSLRTNDNTWSKRELQWYFAEKTFLFASKKEEDSEKWICVIRWLIDGAKIDLVP